MIISSPLSNFNYKNIEVGPAAVNSSDTAGLGNKGKGGSLQLMAGNSGAAALCHCNMAAPTPQTQNQQKNTTNKETKQTNLTPVLALPRGQYHCT